MFSFYKASASAAVFRGQDGWLQLTVLYGDIARLRFLPFFSSRTEPLFEEDNRFGILEPLPEPAEMTAAAASLVKALRDTVSPSCTYSA